VLFRSEADASEINSFKKIKLIETSEQEIKVLEEVKKPVQANESAAESLVMDTSDYEDYGDDEDEKNNLVIEVDNGSEYDADETPASPVELTPQADLPKPKEILMQTEPIEQTIDFIKPKVIPLIRNQELDTKSNKADITADEAAKNKEKINEPETANGSELTLLDLISKMQEKLISSSSTNVKTPAQHILSNLTPVIKPHHSKELAKDYTYIDNMHENLSYYLWQFNSVKIIVRLSVDGYVNTETSSLNSVVLYPKLEYQSQFGGEKLSHKDYCKMWSKSFIRNNCDILLCRINVFTNKLISITNLNHKDILSNYTSFNPQMALILMKNLFEKLENLPEDNYLLSKVESENKLSLMKAADKSRCNFDLHFHFTGFDSDKKDKESHWLPVDPEIYLPYHNQLSRVPCLFEPDPRFKNSPHKKLNNKKKNKSAANKRFSK